jgi:hypothetical protein
MKITSINKRIFANYENFVNYLPKIDTTKDTNTIVNYKVTDVSTKQPTLSTNLLDEALKVMVNNLQSNNNHPLSKKDNMPIETYFEAVGELKQINLQDLRKVGLEAQANLNANDVLQLFLE